MKIEWYFQAWTKESTKPITLWVEAKNQEAARNMIMRHNPFIAKLIFQRTNRIKRMRIYNVIEVNEIDLYDGACVNVYPCATEETAINLFEKLLSKAKKTWFTEYKSEDWSETKDRTSYCGGDSDGRRLQFYVKESEVRP